MPFLLLLVRTFSSESNSTDEYSRISAFTHALLFYSIIHPAKYLRLDNYARTPDMNLSESTFAPIDPQLQEKRTSAGNV